MCRIKIAVAHLKLHLTSKTISLWLYTMSLCVLCTLCAGNVGDGIALNLRTLVKQH